MLSNLFFLCGYVALVTIVPVVYVYYIGLSRVLQINSIVFFALTLAIIAVWLVFVVYGLVYVWQKIRYMVEIAKG